MASPYSYNSPSLQSQLSIIGFHSSLVWSPAVVALVHLARRFRRSCIRWVTPDASSLWFSLSLARCSSPLLSRPLHSNTFRETNRKCNTCPSKCYLLTMTFLSCMIGIGSDIITTPHMQQRPPMIFPKVVRGTTSP